MSDRQPKHHNMGAAVQTFTLVYNTAKNEKRSSKQFRCSVPWTVTHRNQPYTYTNKSQNLQAAGEERDVLSCMEHQNQGLFVSSPLASYDTAHKLAYIRSTNVVNSWNMHTAALHSTRVGQPLRCPVTYIRVDHNFPPIGSCASHRRCCSTD